MSKICIYCGKEVSDSGRCVHPYYCPNCDEDRCLADVTDRMNKTVFEKITDSEEALAESVVMPIMVEYSSDVLWVSPLLQKDASKRAIFFDSKEEAVVATIEELKRVANAN